MEIPSAENKSPNQLLARLITEKLVGKGLVPSSKKRELQQKLESGTARPEDWRLWVDLALSGQKDLGV